MQGEGVEVTGNHEKSTNIDEITYMTNETHWFETIQRNETNQIAMTSGETQMGAYGNREKIMEPMNHNKDQKYNSIVLLTNRLTMRELAVLVPPQVMIFQRAFLNKSQYTQYRSC